MNNKKLVKDKILTALNLSHLAKIQQDKVFFGLINIILARVNIAI